MSTDQVEGSAAARVAEPNEKRYRLLRRTAVTVWLAVLVAWVVLRGLPYEHVFVVAFAMTGAAAASIGRARMWRVLLDFLPLAALLVTWDYLRGISTSLGMPTWWTPQVRADRWLFGGVQPTVWLTEHLRRATPQWWDVPVSLCYVSFFIVPVAIAGVLWVRDRRAFYGWSARYVVISYLAFAVFALAPTAPPWAAARCTAGQVADHPSNPACMYHLPPPSGGLLGAPEHAHAGVTSVQRWSSAGLEQLHLTIARKLLETGQHFTDLVAAVPSLHAGATLLITLFLWRRVRTGWRPVLVLYPLFMGFTLVYTAEHYVTDVLVGYLFALLTALVVARVERRWFAAEPAPAPPR